MPNSNGERQRRLRKGMYILPSLFTTANIAAGFYAIGQATLGAAYAAGFAAPASSAAMHQAAIYFNHAALAIGFAVFFDGMDGAIARLTHTTSDFGRELDSLADVVTFGVAPAVLAWMWGFFSLPLTMDADFREKLIQAGAVIAFAFLTAGACRLARFNITLNPQPRNPGRKDRKYFVGLPIPGGAGCLAAVVHLCLGWPIQDWRLSVGWCVFMCLCAYLMVSTWRFWSSKSLKFADRHASRLFVVFAPMLEAIWYLHRYMLFAIAMTYMISGIVSGISYTFRRREAVPPAPPQAAMEQR
jgi:CDP-diacylglycerol--serine O-phosphatidyltransferase